MRLPALVVAHLEHVIGLEVTTEVGTVCAVPDKHTFDIDPGERLNILVLRAVEPTHAAVQST